MRMVHALQFLGLLLLAVGVGYQVAADRHLAPGRSWLETLMRGSFQRREDYTESGWRYLRTGLKIALAGGALIIISIIISTFAA